MAVKGAPETVLRLCGRTELLDEVKRGNGRVISSRQTQVLQSLEGGLVLEILVREGDIVKQGMLLAASLGEGGTPVLAGFPEDVAPGAKLK